MKFHPSSALMSLAALALPAFADTLTMKDGSTVEGTIVRQDETSYVVEVQVTKSIKDERVIAKDDVAGVKETKPDVIAFESISGLTPTPDALTQGEYARRIKLVEAFLSDHRGSMKTTEARKMLDTLKAEANEILAGAVKLNGKIIAPAEYRTNAYDIDSRIEAARIKRLIDENRNLLALRAFSDFDRDFQNTAAHREMVPVITQVIRTYIGGIAQSLATFDARTKERQVGLERMPLSDRNATAKAIAEEDVMIQRRYDAEKKDKTGWITTYPFFKTSLEETVSFGKQELKRLAALGTAPNPDGGKAYRDALSQIQGGSADAAAITAAIAAARSAGVAPRYIENLEAAARTGGHTP